MGAKGTGRKLVVAGIAASLLAAPALADAAKGKGGAKGKGKGAAKVTERSASVTATGGPGTPLTATATCPKGKKAVSGGFRTGTSSLSSGVTVFESARPTARSWRVSGVLLGGDPITQSLTSYAYCRSGPTPKARSSIAALPVGSGGTGVLPSSATASCPKKTGAISGGFSLTTPTTDTAMFVNASMREGARVWRINAQGFSSAAVATQAATVFAYCLPGKVGSTVTAASAAPTEMLTTAIAPGCARRVVAGGYSGAGSTTPQSVPLITESRRLTRSQWQVATIVSGATTTLTAHGYCG